MTYAVNNNIAQINGDSGPYDNKVSDPSIKYGRNAIANYKEYLTPPDKASYDNLKELGKDVVVLSSSLKQISDPDERQKKLTELSEKQDTYVKLVDEYSKKHPAKFELKYIPGQKVDKKNIDKKALLAASYEELGAESVPISELNSSNPNVSYEAFDINHDGKIDVGENATAMLIEDMASKHSTEESLNSGKLSLNADDISGTIMEEGNNNLTSFLKKDKVDENREIIKQIHDSFGLDEAQKDLLKDKNNS